MVCAPDTGRTGEPARRIDRRTWHSQPVAHRTTHRPGVHVAIVSSPLPHQATSVENDDHLSAGLSRFHHAMRFANLVEREDPGRFGVQPAVLDLPRNPF